MSRVLIGNLPPGTTIRNVDDLCSPFGRLIHLDVKNQGNSALACVEYENIRNSQNLIRARHGYNYNGYTVQLKIMSEDSVSGPPDVRDSKRRQNSPAPSPSASSWSRNNTQSNNQSYEIYDDSNGNNRTPSSNFDNDRGSYYNNNSNRGSVPMDTGNGLDFNQACRIVYERFINEGYNPTLAKERTLEFVNNMQGRSNHTGFTNNNISDYFDQTQGRGVGGMYSNNSDYFGQGMNTNCNFGNDSGNFNGNQNWAGGKGNNCDGNVDSFSNSNWGGFNGPKNQPPSWVGGGGMSRPMQGKDRSRKDRLDSVGSNVSNQRSVCSNQPIMAPQEPTPANVVDHESYTKSAAIRKKIEIKITQGISTPRDLEDLQFHIQIMNDYKHHMRFQSKMGGGGDGTKTEVGVSHLREVADAREPVGYNSTSHRTLPTSLKRRYRKEKFILDKIDKNVENGTVNKLDKYDYKKCFKIDGTKTEVGVSHLREVADAREPVGYNSTSHRTLPTSLKRRYRKAKFILDKIAKNVENGTVNKLDKDDYKKCFKIVEEYEKMKSSQQNNTTLPSKRGRSPC